MIILHVGNGNNKSPWKSMIILKTGSGNNKLALLCSIVVLRPW